MLAQIVIRTEYNKPSSSKTWHVLTFNFCISVMRRKGTEQLTRSAMVKRNHYAIFIWNSLLGITRRNGVPKGQEQLRRKGQNPLRNVCNARKEEKEEKNGPVSASNNFRTEMFDASCYTIKLQLYLPQTLSRLHASETS